MLALLALTAALNSRDSSCLMLRTPVIIIIASSPLNQGKKKAAACLFCFACGDANRSVIMETLVPIILILSHYSPSPPPSCSINERHYELVDASVE